MAWSCSANTNEKLVLALHREMLAKSESVVRAMRAVDRGLFLPTDAAPFAYEDRPLPIGYNVTISAPHMHAMMLELMVPYVRPKVKGQLLRVLDIGSGSGYLTAALAAMCEAEAAAAAGPERLHWQVIGVEHVPKLKERAEGVLQQHFPQWEGLVKFYTGDGRSPCAVLGSDGEAESFDAIHVGAAAREVHPELLQLLRRGGCLVIPVGDQSDAQQLLLCVKQSDGSVRQFKDTLCRFVPLTSIKEQLSSH